MRKIASPEQVDAFDPRPFLEILDIQILAACLRETRMDVEINDLAHPGAMDKPYKLLLLCKCKGGLFMKYLSVLFILLVLTACAKTETPTTGPDLEGDAQVVESGTEKILGETEIKLNVDEVRCFKDEQKVMFSFRNDDTKNWQMNQQVPFPTPKDLGAVRVYINSYEVNGRNPYLREGVRQFGPEERFSDNCGGVEVLESGSSVTCTLYPVPLKEANAYAAGKNEILVHSPTNQHTIQFTC
jgi:hypothetical protein